MAIPLLVAGMHYITRNTESLINGHTGLPLIIIHSLVIDFYVLLSIVVELGQKLLLWLHWSLCVEVK